MYKTGDILHCKGHGILSKLISFFTGSSFTHSALIIEIWGQIYVYESQIKGVELKTLEAWKKKYAYQFEVNRAPYPFNENAFATSALKKSGVTGYDYELFVFRYPVKIILSIFTGKKVEIKREKREDDRMICSELVAYCHGIPNPQNYTPKTLREYCQQNNWSVIK